MADLDLPLKMAADHVTRLGRPLVTLSYAQSLDGSIAATRGAPLSISSPASLALVHQLRAAHAAILVGIGTLLADDPRLNVRKAPGEDPQPVVLDSRLRTPSTAVLFHNSHLRPWILATHGADPHRQTVLEAAGARVVRLPPDDRGHVSLPAALRYLASEGVGSLMVEGGAQVITSFLVHRLVDQVVITLAPVIIGGQPAVESLLHRSGHLNPAEPSCDELDCFARLQDVQYRQFGNDLVVIGALN